MADYGSTDRVRRSAAQLYIEPARRRSEKIVKIHSGTFGKFLVDHKVLSQNRFPIICNALKSEKFLKEKPLATYYEEVLVEALKLAQADADRGLLDDDRIVLLHPGVSLFGGGSTLARSRWI